MHLLKRNKPELGQSPLFPLLPPLIAGICLGIEGYPSFLSYIPFFLGALPLLLIAMHFASRQVSLHPFSHNLIRIYKIACFVCITCLSTLLTLHHLSHPAPQTHYGIVCEPPVTKQRSTQLVLLLEDGSKLMAYVPKDSFHIGQALYFSKQIPSTPSFKELDGYHQYLKCQGIYNSTYIPDYTCLDSLPFTPSVWESVKLKAQICRNKLEAILKHTTLSPQVKALLSALTLGDKTQLSTQQKDEFKTAGISHLLALSGMHVAFVIALLSFFLPKRWINNTTRKILLVIGTWTFIFIVGLPTSAVRAGWMITLVLVNPFPTQQTSPIDKLALTAIMLLLYNPLYLYDVGFQMSFMAVAGLLLSSYILKSRNKFMQLVQCTLVAQIAVLPLTLWHFGQFPTYFIIANLLLVPIITPLLIILTFLLLVFQAEWICQAIKYLVDVQQWVIHLVQQLPGNMLFVENFGVFKMLLCYVVIGLFTYTFTLSNCPKYRG